MGNIEFGSGKIFFSDTLFHCDSTDIKIECPEEYENKSIMTLSKKPREIVFECDVNRNGLLSLIHGRTITNNWLKMHGGVMSRRIRRKIKCTITIH